MIFRKAFLNINSYLPFIVLKIKEKAVHPDKHIHHWFICHSKKVTSYDLLMTRDYDYD